MAFPFTGIRPTHTIAMYSGKTVLTSGSFTALDGPGVLGDLVVFGGVLGVLSITDNTAASGGYGTLLHCTPLTGASGTPTTFTIPLNVKCNAGATVFTSAATNYYITYTRG